MDIFRRQKRHHSAVSKRSKIIQGGIFLEKRKMNLRSGLRRPYMEMSKSSKGFQVDSFPERKGMRVTTYAEKKVNCNIMSRNKTRMKDRTKTETVPKIWIIGSSYIHNGEKAASEIYRENLGLKAKVQWFGKGGLCWSGVLPCFYAELSTHSPPDILVIHAGGNNLGLTRAKALATEIKTDLMQLHEEFPFMSILYSCINERQTWRYRHPCKINAERKTINTLVRKAAGSFGGEVIEHPLLRFCNKSIYMPDGVHFTIEGNRIFLSSIRAALKKILKRRHS